jgi:hypothetical protein
MLQLQPLLRNTPEPQPVTPLARVARVDIGEHRARTACAEVEECAVQPGRRGLRGQTAQPATQAARAPRAFRGSWARPERPV